jgi:hypothetical protein
MRGLIPQIGEEERHVPTPDVAGPMEDTLGMAPSHRHFHVLPSPAIAMGEGWSVQDDRVVEPEDNSARACPPPTLEPPLAWRHVGERRARQCRGRVQRKPQRSMAALTL